MADLEAVARWHDEMAIHVKRQSDHAVVVGALRRAPPHLREEVAMHRVAAAACREAIARRTDPETMGYESASARKAAAKTDAALAEIE